MTNRRSMGPSGHCVCVACGTTAPHARGVPCRELRCPRCGKVMVREGSEHHAAALLQRGRMRSTD